MRYGLAAIVLALIAVATPRGFSGDPPPKPARLGPRPKEVGVVDYYRKFTRPGKDKTGRRVTRNFLALIREIGLKPEWVDPDIFLPANKAKRDRYQRLAISSYTDWFSRKMYEGMNDYVKSGGLLITNSSLVLEDVNANYRIEAAIDKITTYPTETFLGVRGTQSVVMSRIRAVEACPLTKGLRPGAWIELKKPLGGRRTRNRSAEGVVQSDCQMRGKRLPPQPFLTFKHQSKGACIYLVGQVGDLRDPTLRRIFKNVFSARTLDWLCLQE